jgi:hypothetical protein
MTYDVLVTKKDEKFIAHVRAWPGIVAEGDTEEDALTKVQADLKSLLRQGRVVQIDPDVTPTEHPWKQFAGMFADDPDWDEFQASIRQYREEVDRASGEE